MAKKTSVEKILRKAFLGGKDKEWVYDKLLLECYSKEDAERIAEFYAIKYKIISKKEIE